MLDILDEFSFEYDFHDYSNQNLDSGSPSNSFYDCWIYLSGKEEYHDNMPPMNINFLGYDEDGLLAPTDSKEQVTNDEIDNCVTSINNNIEDLEKLKNNLDDIIKYQKDCSKVFELIKVANSRLKNFSNCYYCTLGFYGGELRMTFEIKDEED